MANRGTTGRRAKRDKLVADNLAIVAPIARMVAAQLPDAFDVEDLISIGNIALVESADRYRPKEHNGAPFSAYARMRVRGAMLDSVRRRNYDRVKRTSSIDGGDVPDTPAADGDLDAAIDRARTIEKVNAAIAQLPQRLRRVVELHYTAEMKLVDVSEASGRRRSYAKYLHLEALAQLRTILTADR